MVTFTCRSWGSHQRELHMEIEEEVTQGEADWEDKMLECTTEYLQGAFSNLKACEALVRMP